MMALPNAWVQATPVCALCLFLSQRPGAADPGRCAGLARRSRGHSGPMVDTGVVNDHLAAPAPAQRSGGWPAAVGRRVSRHPTVPAANTPALRFGARRSRRPVRRRYDSEINSNIDAFCGPYPFRDGWMSVD
jgi:hypothetical protein